MDSKSLITASVAVATTASIAYYLHRKRQAAPPLPLAAIHKQMTTFEAAPLASTGRAFIFGLGFTGTRFAQALLQQGWKVAGTVRDQARVAELRRAGIEAFVFDSDDLEDAQNDIVGIVTALASTTHVLVTAAPVAPKRGATAAPASVSEQSSGSQASSIGDPVLSRSKLRTSLQQAADSSVLQWVGYLSSVGVYGDRQGAEVDERTVPTPSSARGKRRRAAECEWQTSGLPLMVFRLPGIYGPGRGPIAKVRSGKARRIVKKGQIFSRIHVDDIVGTLLASMAHPFPGDVYNVVDDRPAPPGIVVAYACHLLQLPVPPEEPFETAELSAMARSFYGECRYIRNTLIKRKLGVVLRYPTYRQGLAAQLREEESQTSQRVLRALKAVVEAPAFALAPGDAPASAHHTHIVLVDNGSLRGAATVNLRRVACALLRDHRVPPGAVVHATSARWSNRVDVTELDGGPPAELFQDCLRRIASHALTRGVQCHIVVLPYFFGPSATVTEFCPDIARKVRTTVCIPLLYAFYRCFWCLNKVYHYSWTIPRNIRNCIQSILNSVQGLSSSFTDDLCSLPGNQDKSVAHKTGPPKKLLLLLLLIV
eukprot:m.322521 g.322521  ORF g.322521 m.322521 type:complete len:596 (+) comp20354_c1_seq1:64-1851(+)